MEGDGPEADARRNRKFKLIPRIVKGSWIVKQSVGTTPVLLGQKVTTRHFRGSNARGRPYFEVDVDITSNTVANSVTSLVVGAITSLVVDLAPVIEGQVRARGRGVGGACVRSGEASALPTAAPSDAAYPNR